MPCCSLVGQMNLQINKSYNVYHCVFVALKRGGIDLAATVFDVGGGDSSVLNMLVEQIEFIGLVI